MATGNGTITELRLEASGLSGRMTCPPGLRPAPGQYLAASGPDLCDPLPVILFPTGVEIDNLEIGPPLPAGWIVGTQLNLRGPLGNGFRLPPSARRLALASLEGSPARLLPLAHLALQQQAAVTLYASAAPPNLPEDVEVLPLDLLPEAPAWADFLALEASLKVLPDLRARLKLQPYERLACQGQVLVHTAMPCCGMAECGVCAVATRERWALACSDGPVFDINQLEGFSP